MTGQKLLLILTILTMVSSCEGIITGKGKIISSADGKPLDKVLVVWINNFNDSCRSDSLGNFLIKDFVGCVPSCPELNLLFHKVGYKNQYLNLSKIERRGIEEVIVKMEPTN